MGPSGFKTKTILADINGFNDVDMACVVIENGMGNENLLSLIHIS